MAGETFESAGVGGQRGAGQRGRDGSRELLSAGYAIAPLTDHSYQFSRSIVIPAVMTVIDRHTGRHGMAY